MWPMPKSYLWSLVAAMAMIPLLLHWLELPWSWQLLALGITGIVGLALRRAALNVQHGPVESVQFIACPHCGTRNPRHAHAVYECYHCERRFSELSGRHPALPEQVAGVSSH